jgi:hypothetical protein
VPTWNLQSSTPAYQKLVKNPSKRGTESGLYFPRLTGYRRKTGKGEDSSTIKIEFSAPKLLYKNNLDELTDAQFGEVIETLRDRLDRMGVVISTADLKQAEVRSIHYSKNIDLRGGYSSRYVIGEIGKINLDRRFDMTKTRYMNEGQSFYAYSVSHSIVLYDKIADLNRGEKRAIDKDPTRYQRGLFDRLKNQSEVLRFEVRLSHARKMNSLLKSLGFPEKPRFQDVYSSSKAVAILTHYWKTMMADNTLPLFAHTSTARDLFRQILFTQKNAKRKTAIYLTGLLLLSQEPGGMRELREVLSKRVHDRTWYRLVSDLRRISANLANQTQRDWYDQVEVALTSYQPYRIDASHHGV